MQGDPGKMVFADKRSALRLQPSEPLVVVQGGIRIVEPEMRRKRDLVLLEHGLTVKDVGMTARMQAEACKLSIANDSGKAEMQDEKGRFGRSIKGSR